MGKPNNRYYNKQIPLLGIINSCAPTSPRGITWSTEGVRGLGFKGVPQINNVPPKKDVGSQENKIGPKHSNNWTATI